MNVCHYVCMYVCMYMCEQESMCSVIAAAINSPNKVVCFCAGLSNDIQERAFCSRRRVDGASSQLCGSC